MLRRLRRADGFRLWPQVYPAIHLPRPIHLEELHIYGNETLRRLILLEYVKAGKWLKGLVTWSRANYSLVSASLVSISNGSLCEMEVESTTKFHSFKSPLRMKFCSSSFRNPPVCWDTCHGNTLLKSFLEFPLGLRALLEDPTILKVGAGIQSMQYSPFYTMKLTPF